MPSGAAVIRYPGKRGVVWYVKYVDAAGRQVKERLGREADGWNRKKAKAELGDRLSDVRRDGYRKPPAVTFGSFAQEWLETYPIAKELKRSTARGYELIVESHLVPAFGMLKLDAIDVERLDRYVARKRHAGLAARTINRHLNLLSLVLGSAVKRGLVKANAVATVDRPREPRRRWRILSPGEIRAVEQTFAALAREATDEERAWREQARVIFLVMADTGIRRGEVQGLRWRTVHLADPAGPRIRVEETWVRAGIDTPKSEAGERTIELSPTIADELFDHRARTAFAGDDERVFCSPTKGTPFDVARYAETFKLALARANVAGRVRPFHDVRHTNLTNGAAAGENPAALQTRAGHSDFKTTQGYIDLSGVAFPEETAKRSQRLWGDSGTKNRYQHDPSSPEAATGPAAELVDETA